MVFCSILIAGDNPSIESTSGLPCSSRNCLAYAERLSTYLRCPSAYIVSNANEDLPDPDRPVITISLSRGRSMLTSFRLCSLAPLTSMNFCIKALSPVTNRKVCGQYTS